MAMRTDEHQRSQRIRQLKIPLSELPDNKTNIRSALNRATRKLQTSVATASDDEFLYVWNS